MPSICSAAIRSGFGRTTTLSGTTALLTQAGLFELSVIHSAIAELWFEPFFLLRQLNCLEGTF